MSNPANCNYFPKKQDNGCCDEGRGPFIFHQIYIGFNDDIFDDVYGRQEVDPCCVNPMKSCRTDSPPKCQKCGTCSTGTYDAMQGGGNNGSYGYGQNSGGQQPYGGNYGGYGRGMGNNGGAYGQSGANSMYAPATGSYIGAMPEKNVQQGNPCGCNSNNNNMSSGCQGERRAGRGTGPCCPAKKKFNPTEIYVGFNETVYKDYGTTDCRCC